MRLMPLSPQENKRVKTFKIDDNLPPTVFAQISRVDAGGGKKKKGKKGKGKKKKKKVGGWMGAAACDGRRRPCPLLWSLSPW